MKMLVVAFAALMPVTAAAQDLSGAIFQTQANDTGHFGMVEFYACGNKTCGRLIRSFDASGAEIPSPYTGRDIVSGMIGSGGGAYSGGTIWDPGADKTYRSKMQVTQKGLDVSGCVSVFCRTQNWLRVR